MPLTGPLSALKPLVAFKRVKKKKKHIQVRPLPEANQIKIVGHEKSQLENEMVVREKNHAPRGCMSVGCYIAHFWRMGEEGLRGGRSGGRREETGDQEAHKNVQEAWLYIRALEILLASEGEERRGMRGEKRGEQMAASNNPKTGWLEKNMNGGVDTAELHMWTDLCERVCFSKADGEHRSLLKVVFIMSDGAVSCADHYHLSAHATATGQRLLRCAWVSLALHRRCARALLCVLHKLSWGEPVVEVCYWYTPRGGGSVLGDTVLPWGDPLVGLRWWTLCVFPWKATYCWLSTWRKPPCESPTDPEGRPTHPLWKHPQWFSSGSPCPSPFESHFHCANDKDKLRLPPLTQKLFGRPILRTPKLVLWCLHTEKRSGGAWGELTMDDSCALRGVQIFPGKQQHQKRGIAQLFSSQENSCFCNEWMHFLFKKQTNCATYLWSNSFVCLFILPIIPIYAF